jgi:hypothetical protein
MGVKEFIQNLNSRSRERKELMKQVDDQIRVQETLEQRKLSSNERELNRYVKEEREVEGEEKKTRTKNKHLYIYI